MNFGEALVALKSGKKVARTGWNGKGMFLFMVDGIEYTTYEGNREVAGYAAIAMKTADGRILVGWLASQTDMLSDDWVIFDDGPVDKP